MIHPFSYLQLFQYVPFHEGLRNESCTEVYIAQIALREAAVAGDSFFSTMRHEPSVLFMQLLTYMRMSRLQDPALFSKIVFEKDIMLDQVSHILSGKWISFRI